MTENEAPIASLPNDESPSIKISSGSIPLEDSTRRLLLYEVLIEEYESQRDSVKPDPPTATEVDIKNVRQPWIDRAEIKSIEAHGNAHREKRTKELDLNRRAALEKKHDGELTGRLLTLLVNAQRESAGVLIEELYKKHNGSKSGPDSTQQERARRTAIAEIYGLIEDHRESLRQQDLADPTQTTTIKQIETQAVESSLEDLDKATAIGDTKPGGEEENGGNDGNSRKGDKPRDTTEELWTEAKQAHARTLRSALCLSGGGIRSATFNLGILQGLARHGLLRQFDYLSTVSGGGFIGSWLTAWIHRQGLDYVIQRLTMAPVSPLDTEPDPVNHLRVFSNYLSPRPGLLSADTWTLIATFGRNLLLTWLVFVPFILLALMAPRVWARLVILQHTETADLLHWCLRIAVGLGWFSLGAAGVLLLGSRIKTQPHDPDQYQNHERMFLLLSLMPGIAFTIALSIGWIRVGSELRTGRWRDYLLFAVVIHSAPWLLSVVYRLGIAILPFFRNGSTDRRDKTAYLKKTALRIVGATFLLFLAQAITGSLLYYVSCHLFPLLENHERMYATLSVPILLAVFALDFSMIVGLTSSLTDDNDLEWWSRAGAWVLITGVAWIAANLLVLYSPSIILQLGNTWHRLFNGPAGMEWSSVFAFVGQVGTVLVGIISGIVTLSGGFSEKVPANDKQAARSSGWTALLPSLLAPVFLGFLIIVFALITNWIIFFVSNLPPNPLFEWLRIVPLVNAWDHAAVVANTPNGLLFMLAILIGLIGTAMGCLINTNKFSLHYMWRNRIVRAYLGASRTVRHPQPFTGFDEDDNIFMYELRDQPAGVKAEADQRKAALTCERDLAAREKAPPLRRPELADGSAVEDGPFPRKLFPVLNVALNLAGGEKLAWQDRKAESFTVSPLHAGSYWLGYRRSLNYGGPEGISLGTAVAISGAFVSPNMGYMMTSPVLRFVMTLFNVRFGWWLGNSGLAGDEANLFERVIVRVKGLFNERRTKPFQRPAPLFSVRPIVEEAFGMTDDRKPYVYLSDGGHFENLGLYEMVLRRCRFIVVCDATSDADYNFFSLAQSVRQIRVDLGVPIDISKMEILPPSTDFRGKYCAIGKIRYSCVDRDSSDPAQKDLVDADFDGTLIYIKASMIGDEPRDVANYGLGSGTFPQETIVDQWFSEAQFESYRALGSHIIDNICGGDQNKISLAAFERKVRDHNRVNFRVFKDRISFAALARQFKKTMQKATPSTYEEKVKEYLKDILD